MSDEWYTPPSIIEDARQVLGAIDLDPCSCALPQQWIRAATFYDVARDGLKQSWKGQRVWLNPPYSKPAPWLAKGLAEPAAVIALVNSSTATRWFQAAAAAADAVCLVGGRIQFINEHGQPTRDNRYESAVLYRGPDEDLFRQVFAGYGVILG